MKKTSPIVLAMLGIVLICAADGLAESLAATAPGRTWTVGTKEAPPFAIRNPDGSWSGVSIDLWRGVAERLGIEYELKEYDLAGLLAATEAGEIDAAVAALTVTAERERVMDFTHPLHSTGLSIAVVPRAGGGRMRLPRGVLSSGFVKAVGALAALLLAVGFLAWVFERRRNPNQFGGGPLRGIGAGFWWSAVTMTTVGYGDKAPVTLGGRLLALVWMFAALIVIATFTGAIASALTVGQLSVAVGGPQDLPDVRVATVGGSTSEAYLRGRRIEPRLVPTAEEGMRLLVDGQVEAFVYDAPLLRYLVKTRFSGKAAVLPGTFQRQDYAIALPTGSPYQERINQALLEQISRPQWQETLYEYLGE